MNIFFSKSAISDLEAIHTYYDDKEMSSTGKRMIHEIIEYIDRLVDFPRLGRKVPEFLQEDLRELILPPFRIVYLIEGSTINLIRVWRSERILVLSELKTK